MNVVRLDTSAHMPDDYQGLEIPGTGDRFDEWWELEHQDDDVDDVDYEIMDDED